MDGEISNVYATGNHILQTDGGTAVTIGKNGRILNNRAYYGAVYINGTDEHLDIYGKINGNISTRIAAAVWYCPIMAETTTQPCMRVLRSATTKPSKQAAEP